MILISVKKRLRAFELDVSLRFDNGLTVMTGHNGSGKSTILKLIAGLENPDHGRIEVMGEVFFDETTNLLPEERRTGYLCQEVALFPWLTVEENISFGLTKSERKEKTDWLEKLYSELDICHLLGRYPNGLSGGESQRVALSRALAPMPGCLLLDEPFSAVDMDTRPGLRLFLREVQKEWRIPVIVVTHDHAEAYTLGDSIFELSNGKVITRKERGGLPSMPLVSY